MPLTMNFSAVSDDELLRRLSALVKQGHRVEADILAHIGEVDARELWAREAVSSLFAYCTEILLLSEHEAYARITAARAAREHPVLLSMLRNGSLNLSGIALLARHLTPDSRDEVLRRAAGRTFKQLRELVAELAPKPDVRSTIRKLPVRRAEEPTSVPTQLGTYRVESSTLRLASPGSSPGEASPTDADGSVSRTGCPGPVPSGPPTSEAEPPPRAVVEPLSPARYKVAFTADQELRDMLERLQALMRPSVPEGDLAAVLKAAVKEKLERLEAKRFGKVGKPRKKLAETDTTPRSRNIPAPVKRAVHERDGGRCTFRDQRGRRCSEKRHLEFHHRVPFGQGGEHRPENLTLHCRAHNNLAAERDYGKEVMRSHRQRSSRPLPDRTPSVPVSRRRGHG